MNATSNAEPAELSTQLPRLGRQFAHDLNNAVSVISSSAYLIDDILRSASEASTREEVQPFVTAISEEAHRLKSSIEEFLRLLTIESVLKQPLQLDTYLLKWAEKNAADISLGNLAATRLIVDPAGLDFVLATLLSYARKEGAKRITASSLSLQNTVSIKITFDLTPSLSADQIADFFNPLPRRHTPGMGVRLPLAYKIVALHCGRISISSSEAESAFIIDFPIIPPNPPRSDINTNQ